MQITLIGTGYVGLVTGACFAEMGHAVTCLDINQTKIDKLNNGIIPIYEPGLEEMVERNSKEHRLFFTTNYQEALKDAEVCFIAVSTPSQENGACELGYVYAAAEEIAANIENPVILVIKSTVPVGTSKAVEKRVNEILAKRGKSFSLDVVSNPEFLKEGSAISDCLKPTRIIIGSNSEAATQVLKELYSPFTINHDRIICMDPFSSELTKYAANAMLATRISFMNELSALCELSGANINHVRIGIGSDNRIGYDFLYPGVGWGGSCFPKDIRALIYQAESFECGTPILRAIEQVNKMQKKVLVRKMLDYFEGKEGLKGKTIAIWGLAFKPNTDDIREAPSLQLIDDLLKNGAKIKAYDPIAMNNVRAIYSDVQGIEFCTDHYEAAKEADAIALVTEWKQFRSADIKKLSTLMRGKVFFDGRNQFQAETFNKYGIDYFGIGIPQVESEFSAVL